MLAASESIRFTMTFQCSLPETGGKDPTAISAQWPSGTHVDFSREISTPGGEWVLVGLPILSGPMAASDGEKDEWVATGPRGESGRAYK